MLRCRTSGVDTFRPAQEARPSQVVGESVARDWLSVAELQAWLGLGRSKAYELLNGPDGIPGYRIGRVIRVRKQDVEQWLQNNRYRSGL